MEEEQAAGGGGHGAAPAQVSSPHGQLPQRPRSVWDLLPGDKKHQK